MSGPKAQIAEALKSAISNVTIANGYSQDVNYIAFDKVKLNIAEYQDYELPAVQIIDLSAGYNHEQSRSKTSWFLTVEICMRTTAALGVVDQASLWDLQEDIVRAIMSDPRLGLSFVVSVSLVDAVTDLHMQEPNYIANIGLEIIYYEPITRNAC